MAAHTFLQPPELGLAFPFDNLSFQRWDGALPDCWARPTSSTTGTMAKYVPGFDMTRALKISDTGVVSTMTNALDNAIALPAYIQNGQALRAGYSEISALAGYGAAKAVLVVGQDNFAHQQIGSLYRENDASWYLQQWNSGTGIDTSHADLAIRLYVLSSGGSSAPAVAFDALFVEYGRTTAERYYAFPYMPEASGVRISPFTFGKSDRTGRGKRRTYDPTGGAVKWRVVFPFQNIPDTFVEVLSEFWRINKGLDDRPGRPLVLHHYIQDPAAVHTTGHDWLKRPPFIICDIVEEELPFQQVGSFLGRKIFTGTLTFEEI